MTNNYSEKTLSKSAQKKIDTSCYWRNQHNCSLEIDYAREEFSKKVGVLSLESTSTSNSYSAIIDTKRCIVVK